MTRKILLFAGVIALAITTISTTKTQPTTGSQSTTGAQPNRSSQHYSWHNSYKAVVDQTAAVVHGTVTSVKESYNEKEGPRTLVTLSRLSPLWGEFKSSDVTLKIFGGALPRRGRVDEVHLPKFVSGKRYLVFLSNREWRLSPVTAHQVFIIERVHNKDVLVTTDGHAIYGIDDATGPVRKFPIYRIPDQVEDNFIPRVDPRVTSRMVANAYSPAEFVSDLKAWAKKNNVSVAGAFNEQPYTTGNWRVNRAVPDRAAAESTSGKQFEPRPGERKVAAREQKPCWNRTTPTDTDPKDRSPLCLQGDEK